MIGSATRKFSHGLLLKRVDVGSVPGRAKSDYKNWHLQLPCWAFSSKKEPCKAYTSYGRQGGRWQLGSKVWCAVSRPKATWQINCSYCRITESEQNYIFLHIRKISNAEKLLTSTTIFKFNLLFFEAERNFRFKLSNSGDAQHNFRNYDTGFSYQVKAQTNFRN